MNRIARGLVSLAAGAAALAAVGIAVTALLAPHVWPAAMVGLPAGVVAGLSAAVLTFAGLTARAERRRDGALSPGTRTLVLASVGGVAGFVAGGVGVSAVVFLAGGVGLASAMLFVGLPASLLGALLGAALAVVYGRRRRGRPAPATQ